MAGSHNHDRVLRFQFHPGQAAIYNSPARFKVVAAGRRFGKSHFAAIMLGIEALKEHNERGHQLTIEHGVYYIAPTFDQGKRVMWPKLKQLLGYERTGGFIRNENVNEGWLELLNGRKIYVKGAEDPERLRGIGLSYVVLDEYADMKANVWSEIIRPALMDVEGSALFIGTPKGKNHFYQLFMGALEKPVDPRTNSNEHWQEWEAFHFKSMDNPFLRRTELSAIQADPNMTREALRQELDASFLSGGGKVLNRDWFPIMRANQIPPAHPTALSPGGSIFITVDPNGFEKDGKKLVKKDDTSIAVVQTIQDMWYVLRIRHGKWDVRKTALNIINTVRAYPGSRLGIEKGSLANALGPYLDEYMREFARYVTPEPLSHGNTKKQDRIAWALQGRAERRQIALRADDDLSGEDKWVDKFLEQCSDFPDPLAKDDLIDSVAYVDQMAKANYVTSAHIIEWQPLDPDSGY
jgi:hypothetical protein